MTMQEIARIVTSNTARIDLPTWLRSAPYVVMSMSVCLFACLSVHSHHLKTARPNLSNGMLEP